MPGLVAMFGEDAFDAPISDPWEKLMTHADDQCCLSSGLRHAWSHLQNSFQDVATSGQKDDESLLLNRHLTNAGFSEDGELNHSVTKALTKELEGARSNKLGEKIVEEFERTHFERWA